MDAGLEEEKLDDISTQAGQKQRAVIQIDELAATHNIEWHWVKGHSGHIENERVDELANKGIDEFLAGQR